jgi:hypothetical protein
MAVITCPQCGKEFEDDVLLCPHCGTAQIPQLSKADLREQNLKASRGPFGFILAGTGVGLLIGALVLTVAALRDEATLAHGAGMLLAGMLGGAAGIVAHHYFVIRKG